MFCVVFLVPLDVVVADAIVKNVPNFDLKLAKEALIKDVRAFMCWRIFLLRRFVVAKGLSLYSSTKCVHISFLTNDNYFYVVLHTSQSFSDPPSYAGGSVGKSGINTYINKGYFPINAGTQLSFKWIIVFRAT